MRKILKQLREVWTYFLNYLGTTTILEGGGKNVNTDHVWSCFWEVTKTGSCDTSINIQYSMEDWDLEIWVTSLTDGRYMVSWKQSKSMAYRTHTVFLGTFEAGSFRHIGILLQQKYKGRTSLIHRDIFKDLTSIFNNEQIIEIVEP